MEHFYGKATRLDPPIVIDGNEYSVGIVFNSNPEEPTDSSVTTGRVADISGTTTKTITCARDFQNFSRTVVLGFRNSFEQAYRCLMGGNVASVHEPQRGYSFNNNNAHRGNDLHHRAQKGDTLEWNGKHFEIVDVEPMAIAPSEVSWQGTEHIPEVFIYRVSINELMLDSPDLDKNPEASIYLDDPDDDEATGLFTPGVWVNDGSDFLPLSRKIFNSDRSWWPHDASLSAMEYFESGGRFWLSPSLESVGNQVASIYYHRDLSAIDCALQCIIKGEGGGYDDGADALARGTQFLSGNQDLQFSIYNGSGSIEFRLLNHPGSPMAALTFANGEITGILYRETQDGALTNQTFTPPATSTGFFFNVWVQRTGSTIRFYYGDEGNSRVQVGSDITLSAISTFPGFYSAGVWGDSFLDVFGWGGTGEAQVYSFPGASHRAWNQKIAFFDDIEFDQTFSIPSSQSISKVELLTADNAPMSAGTGARNRYTTSSDPRTITFNSLSNGDQVRVELAVRTGTPAKPGDAPRAEATVNFATEGSSIVSENRAHYHDRIVIADPLQRFGGGSGDTFTIGRSAVFASTPVLSYQTRDGQANDSDAWQAISSSDAFVIPVEGLVLLKKDFADPLLGDGLCVRAQADVVSHAPVFRARELNELSTSIEALEDTWVPVQFSPGGSMKLAGEVGTPQNPGGTSVSCFGSTRGVIYSDWRLGYTKNGLSNWQRAINHVNGNFGRQAIHGSDTGIVYFDGQSIANIYPYNSFQCCDGSGCTTHVDQDLTRETDYALVKPWPEYIGSTPGSWMGALLVRSGSGPSLIIPDFSDSQFDAKQLAMPEIFKRLPAGTTILEAWCEARFDGLSSYNWSFTERIDNLDRFGPWGNNVPGETRRRTTGTVNGVTILDYDSNEPDDWVTNPLPDATSSASIQIRLMGRRKNTQHIDDVMYLPHGIASWSSATMISLPVDAGRFRGFGSGISVAGSTAEDGKWRRINATGLCRGLLAAAHSAYSEFFMVPSRNVALGDEASKLSSFARATAPTYTLTPNQTSDRISWTLSGSGQFTQWNDWSIRNLMMRFRLPSGVVQDKTFPLIMPGPL